MTERLRILLVEDVADDAELALLELRRSGLHADQRVVDSESRSSVRSTNSRQT